MNTNIILMGPPGCGKTTVGKILAKEFKKSFIDIDDYMEEKNNRTVASVLDELGDDKFLDFEAEQTFSINVENHIISTTGSSPLRPKAMQHLHKNGIVVYMDTPVEIIEARLHEMKVDRIVGMKTQSIKEILDWRKTNFYDPYPVDLHIKLNSNETPEEVAQKIIQTIEVIKYRSTRGDKSKYTFDEAILKGIANDGGLLVPESIPLLSNNELEILKSQAYQERASTIFRLFKTGFNDEKIEEIAQEAYGEKFDNPEIAPIKHLKDNQYMLELWHGPTSAFKDMALQFKPLCFSESIRLENEKRKTEGKTEKRYLILAATSGDTGKAALEGYKNRKQIKIVAFYPQNGVSEIQRKQMLTQEGNNVEVYGIDGNFDDAQNAVKQMFNDPDFNAKLNQENVFLSSANSINWGRILPQIFYYISAYCDLLNKKIIQENELIDVAVPTGNFGNILAAYYAKQMGIPIDKLICASNENSILTDFIQTGIYDLTQRNLIKTPSPSMDILISSNLERLLFEITQDSEKIKQWMHDLKNNLRFEVDAETLAKIQENFVSGKCDNATTLETLKKVYDRTSYLMDPHTAVVQEVIEEYLEKSGSQKPVLIASTAHWAKFGSDVYRALNKVSVEEKITIEDEFEILEEIAKKTGKDIPENLAKLKEHEVLHDRVCSKKITEIKKLVWKFAV